MKNSIYIRNFFATALIVLISFTILGGLSTAWSYSRSITEKRSAMASTLGETARYVTTQHLFYGVELSDLNLSMWLAYISGMSGFDLLVTDLHGTVSACSDKDMRYIGETVPESALTLAISDSNFMMMSTLDHIYPERRQVAGAPLTASINGEPYVVGYIFITSDMASFRQAWRNFSSVFTLIALVVMALAFIISFVTTKRQAEPLNDMAGAARRFARGDFSARVGDFGRIDEIGQLAQAFNAMADSLESAETLRRDFIANLSHELKTPMTVIAGFADGILDGTIPIENATGYLSVISSETHRLSRLVGGMLDMSKLQSPDAGVILKNSFDISEVTRLALLSLERKIEDKQLGVEAELPEEPVITRGDMDSITQVVYNLIDNAIKFSAPGGQIRLELWKQGDRAYVSVENSGEMIPEDEMPYIFERFHKTDKSRSADREGVGLGLYIVKTILDNHNEDIFVTSGGGITKFVFTLTIV
ncbi:MAG: HAMP domain-containing histidine kinase [Oscillospiraceae bacterium]|jgi:signal transduction histidine kinase|nr:HAMP domain-containing histidine kinase [Oscillospiraceae bacterium]